MHNDFLYKLTQEGVGQFFKVHVLADNVHKLFCVYGSFLCFGKLRLYSGNTLFQFLLFGFIVCRKLRETLVRNATAYAVLVQPLENGGQLRNSLFGGVQFLAFGGVPALALKNYRFPRRLWFADILACSTNIAIAAACSARCSPLQR